MLAGLLLLAAALVMVRLWPRPPLAAGIPLSTAVYSADGALLRLTLSADDKYRLWLPLARMPDRLVQAVLVQEDRWFRWHPGFNPFSLVRGGFVTYVRGGARQGGSTLSMQLARLRWRLDTRSVAGKLVQVLRAMQLELCYSKDAILEAYLNLAPFGGNVEGAAAASLVYFDKPVAQLSVPEALALAVLPQDPSRRLRGAFARHAGDADASALNDARQRLYQRWRARFGADAGLATAMRLPLTLRAASEMPFLAPHAVEALLREARRWGALPQRLDSTIDLRLQRSIERQLRAFVAEQRLRDLDNAAALLVDTRDMGVKALVGSADWADAGIQGQVDGTEAKRSPGSTLKPFVYALALDQGVLHPRTVLRDVPTAFGPFSPENFDGRFLGPVTATEALIRSRNIPAVQVAARLADPDLYGFLRSAGIARMASRAHYGLALVLGGGEVSMRELARLYALLANRGVLRPLRYRSDAPVGDAVRLLSAEASFITLDMLRQNPRPDEGVPARGGRLPVYWKTGTSWGFRDAWSAGIFGPYVLIVWSGHFDGRGNPALIGSEAAAPLFFRIVDALIAQQPGLSEPAWTIPGGVRRVDVCLASGDLPNADCPQVGPTWFIPGKSPIRVSSVHRAVWIDTRSGGLACPPYDPRHTRREVREYWPSDLAQVFASAGMPRRPPPSGDCTQSGPEIGEPPRIESPLRGVAYVLRRSQPERNHIVLSARADADAQTLYWFADDAFLGSSRPGANLLWSTPTPGRHSLRVVDTHGRVDVRDVRVEVVE